MEQIIDLMVVNKEILKLFFGILIGLICLTIVFRTDKLFKISYYQGIRYFRNAFFFYGIAFILRFVIGSEFIISHFSAYYIINKALVEFFFIMGGFFLLYSLLWKKFEPQQHSYSSLLNPRIILFYALTLVFVVFDAIWNTFALMFISQILLFFSMTIISYKNYRKKPGKKFPKFYFIAMLIGLIAWLCNLLIAIWLDWEVIILIGIYLLNIIVFLVFLFGVLNVSKKS